MAEPDLPARRGEGLRRGADGARRLRHPPADARAASRPISSPTHALGVAIGVVVGGGNIFRGVKVSEQGIPRVTGDMMGILATVMNALALESAIEQAGAAARTMSALAMPEVCETYERRQRAAPSRRGPHGPARRPAPAIRSSPPTPPRCCGRPRSAREAVLKATDVDGVYSADPKKDKTAKRYDRLTHQEAIERNLKVMDATAFALARENRMPIIVFSIREQERSRRCCAERDAPLSSAIEAVASARLQRAHESGNARGIDQRIRRVAMANPTHDINELKRRMQGAIQLLKQELGGLRTGRASASLLEPVQVEAYGTHMPLNQVATVSVPEPRLLSVQVWDRSMVHAVEKAIAASNLGLTPSTEGQVLRLRIPELNEERRRDLVKVAHKYAEAARVAVRHVRRDGLDVLKKLEKDHKISEDDGKRSSEQVQKATDEVIAEVDKMLAAKERKSSRCEVDSRCRRPSRCALSRSAIFAVPRHVAIIMDGNGRWAAARGLPRGEGHRRGVEALRRTVRAAGDLGIGFLTIFSFSAENWSRPPAEIRELMGLLRRFIRHDLADLHRERRARARDRRARESRSRHPAAAG